ncbi:MAG: hypothetical protein RTU30_16520 [Candidatus Thorarchaeota archaeon]
MQDNTNTRPQGVWMLLLVQMTKSLIYFFIAFVEDIKYYYFIDNYPPDWPPFSIVNYAILYIGPAIVAMMIGLFQLVRSRFSWVMMLISSGFVFFIVTFGSERMYNEYLYSLNSWFLYKFTFWWILMGLSVMGLLIALHKESRQYYRIP